MSLFIEIQDSPWPFPDPLAVQVGDILRFSACGALIESGSCIEILGILADAVVGSDGQVLRPLGSPNVVLVRARSAGCTAVDIVTGDPWGSTATTTFAIVVGP
jgi:hypothetical protein